MGMEKAYKMIGLRIKAIRAAIRPKMSGGDLAEKAGLSATTIYNLENGNIPEVKLDTILRVAEALNVPVSAIVDDEFTAEAASLIDTIRKTLQKETTKSARKKSA